MEPLQQERYIYNKPLHKGHWLRSQKLTLSIVLIHWEPLKEDNHPDEFVLSPTCTLFRRFHRIVNKILPSPYHCENTDIPKHTEPKVLLKLTNTSGSLCFPQDMVKKVRLAHLDWDQSQEKQQIYWRFVDTPWAHSRTVAGRHARQNTSPGVPLQLIQIPVSYRAADESPTVCVCVCMHTTIWYLTPAHNKYMQAEKEREEREKEKERERERSKWQLIANASPYIVPQQKSPKPDQRERKAPFKEDVKYLKNQTTYPKLKAATTLTIAYY